jgi:hypothetical protein
MSATGLTDLVSGVDFGRLACTTGKWVAGVSFVFGAVKGFQQWSEWLGKREYIVVEGYDSLSPVVNIAQCAGVFALDVVGSGVVSAVVGVTAPVSVPLINVYSKRNQKNQSTDDATQKTTVDAS